MSQKSWLCQYSDIFGKPDTGSHKYKIGGIAVVDTVATLFVALLIGWIFELNGLGVVGVFGLLMIASVFAHKLFCVDTALVKMLGV